MRPVPLNHRRDARSNHEAVKGTRTILGVRSAERGPRGVGERKRVKELFTESLYISGPCHSAP
jgi:hypothetical protein